MQSHHTGGIYLLELDTRSTIVAHSIAVLQSLSKMLKESTTPTTPLRFWLQLCKLLAVALNFSDSVSNGQGRAGTAVHAASTVSMNPSKLGQKASKWKRLLLVGLSCRPSKRGQWSESPEAQLCKRQSGNSCFRGAVLEQGIY